MCSGGSAEGSGEEGETVGGGAGVTAAKACLPTQTRMDAFQGPNGEELSAQYVAPTLHLLMRSLL